MTLGWLSVGVATAALSYILVGGMRIVATRARLLDVPNERSSHTTPVPLGGGVAIVLLILCGSLVLARGTPGADVLRGYWLGLIIVAGISGLDDIRPQPALLRLLCHFLGAAIVVFLTNAGAPHVPAPLGLATIAVAGVTCFWIVGLTNAYNFMDGIDGIAAGQAIVAAGFWVLASIWLHVPAVTLLSVLVLGAAVGFLFHNRPPATIFMGDIGSATLGFTFAVLPVLAYRATDDPKVFGFGVLCVAPFLFDTALTLTRRLWRGEAIHQAHRSHLYQRQVAAGRSHASVSVSYAMLALVTGGVGLAYLVLG